MRSSSSALLAAIAAQESGEAVLILLTIQHASFATMRFVNDTKDIVSGGDLFKARAFALALPQEAPEGFPDTPIVVDNTDLLVGNGFAQVLPRSAKPVVTIRVVLASTPNTIEATFVGEVTQVADGNGASITLTVDAEPLLDEPFPGEMFTPERFPSMFVSA